MSSRGKLIVSLPLNSKGNENNCSGKYLYFHSLNVEICRFNCTKLLYSTNVPTDFDFDDNIDDPEYYPPSIEDSESSDKEVIGTYLSNLNCNLDKI